MSMELCDKCNQAIDTDHDAECYVDVPGFDRALVACKPCRERMAEAGELDVETNTLIVGAA